MICWCLICCIMCDNSFDKFSHQKMQDCFFYVSEIMLCIDSCDFGIDTSFVYVSEIKLWIDSYDFGIDTMSNIHSGIMSTYSMHRRIRIVHRYKLPSCFWNWALYRLNRVWHRYIVKWPLWNSFNLQYASMHTCLYRLIHIK